MSDTTGRHSEPGGEDSASQWQTRRLPTSDGGEHRAGPDEWTSGSDDSAVSAGSHAVDAGDGHAQPDRSYREQQRPTDIDASTAAPSSGAHAGGR